MANPKSVQEIIDLWEYATRLSATTDARFAELTQKLLDTEEALTNYINTRVDAAILKAEMELAEAHARIDQILPPLSSGDINLNGLVTPGRYLVHATSTVWASYPLQEDLWWWVDVRKVGDSNWVLQEAVSHDNPRDHYVRKSDDTGSIWTGWMLQYAEFMG